LIIGKEVEEKRVGESLRSEDVESEESSACKGLNWLNLGRAILV
jgi:hypothetical protein